MVVISSMYIAIFLLRSLLLASQRPARVDDQHATIESGSLDHPGYLAVQRSVLNSFEQIFAKA